MSAPSWLLEAINATESKHVPTVPKPGNKSWEQDRKPETPINKGFTSSVPTVPSVPMKIKPSSDKSEIVDTQRESRRKKVLSLLEGKRFAFFVDDDTTDPVIVTVGIQSAATFELEIPLHSYDGTVLLELIEKHYGEKDGNIWKRP